MSTYSVKPCLYDTASGEKQGYLIVTKELSLVFLDLLPVNRCLHEVAIGSDTTCRQYAYRICRWLNWLEERGKSYRDALLDDIGIFMTQLLYNITSSVIDISEGSKSPHTLEGYFAAIRRLYVYLQRIGVTTEMKLMLVRKKGTKESFSYGLSFATVKPDLIIDRSYKKGKKPTYKTSTWRGVNM